jgi:8-oxo-dGTP pyrophosphatase MutT (NUDIX family)
MGAGAGNPRDSGLPHALPERTYQPSARLVRLSQLRKLCECEQVAAVCYRLRGDGIEFLLVRTRGGGRWTFPKGSAEAGLTHAQAAALEAFEEAGVHGRIEETSFATYVRRERGAGKSDAKSSGKKFAVSAHLCEVLRLSAPKESGRNQTWFSASEARQRLREGRRSEDGGEFARVIYKAVARLRWLQAEAGIVDDRAQDRPQKNALHRDTLQKDGLQKVRFEAFAEAAGEEALFMQNIRRQLNGMRQFAVPVVDAYPHEILRGEVLQFNSAREKKTKALGTGAKNR